MPESLTIQSYKGPYEVHFDAALRSHAGQLLAGETHALVDARVARLYPEALAPILSLSTTILIDATEENKSIERIIPVIERLVENKIRRDHVLLAIGGGIIQDITCFIASTLMRGVTWHFVPTTLLAQADSCIGSKSSVNLGATKNILGTFNPPAKIVIDAGLLDTLDPVDVRSGIGEIIKVHAIDGAESFDRLAAEFDQLTTDRAVLARFIRSALLIKQRYIEIDEWDRGVRNIFNYGHSFGHAIEAATGFGVPHGIAVTMGMAMANHIAVQRGLTSEENRRRMLPVLRKNFAEFGSFPIANDDLLGALMKDKKNTSTRLVVILPTGEEARIERVQVPPDETFRAQCATALEALAA
ncbi:AroB-related putative sugar phosphate phospholyase (cyclizing) [Sphingomonas sp. NPDC092331]|uniref:AroB-related putative sugar phosphate phospholyase (cyclizing) n=1 Tax=unclassified Sphingomonas TaxID=196159 RepID=UPI0029EAD623|nr:3-dehydroquinate synthase [Pseudomonadota bacterium]